MLIRARGKCSAHWQKDAERHLEPQSSSLFYSLIHPKSHLRMNIENNLPFHLPRALKFMFILFNGFTFIKREIYTYTNHDALYSMKPGNLTSKSALHFGISLSLIYWYGTSHHTFWSQAAVKQYFWFKSVKSVPTQFQIFEFMETWPIRYFVLN